MASHKIDLTPLYRSKARDHFANTFSFFDIWLEQIFRIPPSRTANPVSQTLHLGFGPTMEKVPVASGKDLMTLRKDLMRVGKDRIWDLFRAREFP